MFKLLFTLKAIWRGTKKKVEVGNWRMLLMCVCCCVNNICDFRTLEIGISMEKYLFKFLIFSFLKHNHSSLVTITMLVFFFSLLISACCCFYVAQKCANATWWFTMFWFKRNFHLLALLICIMLLVFNSLSVKKCSLITLLSIASTKNLLLNNHQSLYMRV